MNSPRFHLTLGVALLLLGWIIPLMMIMHIIPSSFALNLLGWVFSVTGLFLGFVGGAMMAGKGKE